MRYDCQWDMFLNVPSHVKGVLGVCKDPRQILSPPLEVQMSCDTQYHKHRSLIGHKKEGTSPMSSSRNKQSMNAEKQPEVKF
jgi:hypothetical protein